MKRLEFQHRRNRLCNTEIKEDKLICPNCGKTFNTIDFDEFYIPIFSGQKIYKCFTSKSEDFNTVTGLIIENKKYKGIMGIKNLSNDIWKITSPKGEIKDLNPSEVSVIKSGMKIDFYKGIKCNI